MWASWAFTTSVKFITMAVSMPSTMEAPHPKRSWSHVLLSGFRSSFPKQYLVYSAQERLYISRTALALVASLLVPVGKLYWICLQDWAAPPAGGQGKEGCGPPGTSRGGLCCCWCLLSGPCVVSGPRPCAVC